MASEKQPRRKRKRPNWVGIPTKWLWDEIERRNSIAYARNVNAEYRARRAHAESQKKERGK